MKSNRLAQAATREAMVLAAWPRARRLAIQALTSSLLMRSGSASPPMNC
jgi:hypothetical protein